jgi:ABC-type multidrug transport system permease subunit
MVRVSRWLIPVVVALALLTMTASAVQAQVVCYQPAPVAVAPVTSYYAPAPVPAYYAPAPVTTYYAPAPVVPSYYAAPAPVVPSYYAAPAVTAYRYGPLGRLRSVRSYYAAPVGVPGFGYYYP